MKNIDGIEALKQILIIGKKIYKTTNKLIETKIFGDDIELDLGFDIFGIVEKLINYADYQEDYRIDEWQDYSADGYQGKPPKINNMIAEIIFDYFDDKLTLDELINQLLKEN